MKKYLLSLITLTLLLCEASFTGGGVAFAFDNGNYTYTIISSVDKTVSVKWKSGTSPETITIPSTVTYSSTTYKVIAVEDNAFKNCTTAITITIGSNVKTIGSSAFNGCSNVTSINFGSGTSYPCNVDTIKGSAFSSCSKLATINCYGGIEKWLAIGFNAGAAHPFTANSDDKTFKINNTAITEIEVPSTVTKIKKYAFYKNTALTSITIGIGVTSIGSYAFNGCSNLTTIKFGKSTDEPCNVDTIMDNVFTSCTKVNKVYCYGGIEKWLAIKFCNNANGTPYGASTQTTKYFYLDGSSKTTVDISGTQVKPYAFYKSPVSTVNIGASVQTIGTYAFYGSKLTNLNFTNDSELTRIGAYAFASCTSLKTPTLPTSLTRIDGNAFNGCTSTNFKSITIPVNVTVCGDGVFTGCSNLNSVVWNATNCVTYDGTNPFKFNYGPFYNITVKGQITSFTFGDAVEVIPMFCCYNMPNITLLTVPESVESIGEKAFSGCTGLTTIVAKPVDPSSCGTNAFESVNKDIPVVLTSPTSVADYRLAGGWSDFTNISNTLSGSCGTNATWTLNLATGLLTISGTGAISNYTSNSPAPWNDYITYISDIVINSGITTLGERCFASCDVETLNIPASVTQIESQSFLSAKAKKLYYGSTISNWCAITMGAYNTLPQTQELYINSSKITSLTLPAIASLGTKAFMNMKGITSVTIPASLTTIGADAFSGCSNLADVYFQGTLAQWCAISFSNDQEANPAYNGAALHIDDSDIEGTVMVVKNAITSISNYAFCGVNNYTSIEINAETTIGANTFKNCTAQVLYRGSASGTSGNVSWTWEDGALTLTGTGTMNNYTATPSAPWSQYMASTTSIIVGEGITSLGEYAFYATAASSVTLSLPSTLTSIGKSVGYGLKDLRILVIPDAVTTIGTSAFSSCTNLEKIYCPATRPTLNKDYGAPKYTNFPSNKAFYVTASSYSSQYAGQWTDFSPQWFAYGDCGASGDNLTFIYEVATGTLTISGTGAMANYSSAADVPWSAYQSAITSVVVESGVTSLGKYAFANCTALASTSIASSCTTFGMYAFSGCTSLSEVILHEGITSMGSYVFSGCSNLSNVTLPSTLTEVSPRAFENTGLTEIDIPEGVITLNNYAFYNCTSLESVQLPSTLVNINYNVFDGCTSLSDITLPEGLAKIDIYAFQNCSNLASINIPNTVTTINHDAFSGCSKLASVTYGDAPTLATIGQYAFKNCTTLTSITIPASVTSIDCNAGQSQIKSTFYGCTGLRTVVWNAANCSNFTYAYYNGNSHNYYTPFYDVWANITSFTFGPEVEHIPAYLCYGMNNEAFENIAIPGSVTSIGTKAFDGCSSVTMVTCNATTPPTVQSNTFSSITSNAALVVQGASKANYVAADYWQDFYRILPYVVQYDLNGHGSAEIADEYVGYGGRIEYAPADPTADYYTFGGWYSNEGCTTPFTFGESGTVVNGDLTLYAKWTIYNYQVTFDLQGHGSSIAAQTIDHGGLVSKPADPSAEHYIFGGWFKDDACSNAWNFSEDHVTSATTLYAKWTLEDLTLNDNANNASVLALYDDETTTVHLTRSLISASYNTICLPFAMTEAQVETYFGANCDIEELTKASCADGNLKLFFTKRTAIEAGKPYLIKPQSDVANPVIADVTIDNTANPSVFEGVTFTGIFSPKDLANREDLLFLGTGNTLYMSSGGTMKGMRGYFELTTPQAQAAARRSARIILHEEGATGIETVNGDGLRVTGEKIIRDGQLFILRDGKTYNAQGALIK